MDCLYQFKTEECNPLNLTDKCKEIFECVQKSSSDIDEFEIMTQMIKRTSTTLTVGTSGFGVRSASDQLLER